jgi:tetratricopeptide (TPR) repeat protein
MAEALALASATPSDLYGYGRRLIGQGDKTWALEVFKVNAKKNKGHWLAIHGLARGYSANGDYVKALSYEKQALDKCPEGSKQFLQGYVKKLEKGEDFN